MSETTKCPRCGKPQPPDSVHTCSPRRPDVRPVGETAASPWSMLGDSAAEQSAYDRIYAVIGDCDAIQLDRYLAEYRAACRAALLRDAPVVFVATDKSASVSELSDKPFEMSNGVALADEDAEVVTIWNHPPLTPPGTVRRAYLVIPEGEET